MHRHHQMQSPRSFPVSATIEPLPLLDEEFDFDALTLLETPEPVAAQAKPEISWEDIEDSGAVDLAA